MSTTSEMMKKVREICPLVHMITNYVTVNDCANVCICAGGSPVMTDAAEDVPDMVKLASAVVLNIGTLNSRTVDSMILAGKTANAKGTPVILDPVGVGATKYRTETAERILKEDKVSIIKGNHGEISVMAGLGGEVRGVDSAKGADNVAEAAKTLAARTGCIVAATGPVDYVSDGKTVITLRNGSEWMSTVSGTGCMLSAVLGAYVGACGPVMESVASAISVMNIASEVAVEGGKVFGPASFKVKLLDSLYNLKTEDVERLLKRE